MKRNFKRVMSLLLTVLMVMTVVPFAGVSAEGEWNCAVDGHEFYGDLVLKNGKHARWCDHCDAFGYTVYNEAEDKTVQVEGLQGCLGGYATCTELAVCDFCNREYGDYDYDNHDFSVSDDKYLATEATCVSKAKYYFSCSWCGGSADWYADEDTDWDEITYTKGAVDRVAGHRGEATANENDTHFIEECYLCGETDITAPCFGSGATCQEKATCWQCNEKYGEVDTTRHEETQWKDAEEATCQAPGHYGYEYCVDCEAETSEKEVIPQLDHTYTAFAKDADADTHSKYCTTCDETVGEVSVITEDCTGGTANCTTKATCEVCNAVYGDVKHTWNSGVETTAPTCSATGVKTYTCTVENCGATKTEDIAISAGSHNWGTTLHKDADQKHYVVCEYNAEHKNHINCTAETTVVTAPTCEADGYTTYTCACGNTWTGVPTNKLGHNYTKKVETADYLVSAATCQKNAVYYYVCANGTCGKNAKDATEADVVKTYEKEGSITAHNWDVGVVTTPANCMSKGSKLFTCTTCNPDIAAVVTKTEEIPVDPNGHVWGTYVYNNDAKCGVDGTETAPCTIEGCTAEDTRAKAGTALEHNFIVENAEEKYLAVAATCSTKAIYYKSCACGESGKNAEVEAVFEKGEALGHIVETIPGKDPTCTVDGYTESRVCKRPTGEGKTCGAVLKEQVKRPATGHKEYVSVEKSEPTCTKVGYSEEKKCAVCEQLLTLPSMPSSALGHVDSDNDEICDRAGCGTIMSSDGFDCSCMCHQTGIMKIIYFFVNLIWKLIGASKYCDCGVEHY